MDINLILSLIILGLFALVFIANLIYNTVQKYCKHIKNETLDRLERRIDYLEGAWTEKWKMEEDISSLTLKVNRVYNWRQNVLKGYCFKKIEFEEKENKAHFLVVVYDLHKDGVLHTKHVECELVSKFSAQECIKKLAAPITLEQATDYLKQGFLWVPPYEKKENWPVINELMK